MNKEIFIGYCLTIGGIIGGIWVIIFGEIGNSIGNCVFTFRGWERLFGLYPMLVLTLY